MPLLSDAQLTALSNWFESKLFIDDCIIGRKQRVSTPSGGSTVTWTDVLTVKCALVDSGAPQQAMIAEQEVGYITKLAMLPRGTDVHGDDRLTIAGILYFVIDLYEPSTYEVVRRVMVRRASLP
jgi:hypothetical protein